MELGCVLIEELISFFDDETLLQTKSESPRPNRLPRYHPLQISFLNRDGGISKRKLASISKEIRMELEERERWEEKEVQLLHKSFLGVNPKEGACMDVQGSLALIFIALSNSSLSLLLEV